MKKGKKIILTLVSIILFLTTAEPTLASNLILIPNNLPKTCNCTGAPLVNKCGQTYYGLTNIKYQICTSPAGQDTCNYYRVKQDQSIDVYKVVNCTSGGSPTPTPTGGTNPTITPTNPLCNCVAATNSCTTQCQFNKIASITTYPPNDLIKCQKLATTRYQTVPTDNQIKDWCRRSNRTKGDADGNDVVNVLDYFYYVSVKSDGKIPAKINADFNGDGVVNGEDRVVVVRGLNQ